MQLVLSLCLLFHFFSQIDNFNYGELVVYGIFIMLNIFSYGALMDGQKVTYFGEIGKCILVGYIGILSEAGLAFTMDHGPVLCCQSAYGMANTKGRLSFL